MTIILDLDDVLFDTVNFKKSLAAVFRKHGVDFWETYKKAKISGGVYSFKRHLVLAKKENREINIKGIKKEVNKLFANTQQFLFPDVLGFLRKLKDESLILLSWGERGFQKKKVYGLGPAFVSLFDRIIVGPTEKVRVLNRVLNSYKSRPVIFIDNSPRELKKVRGRFKDVILVRLIRSAGHHLSSEKDYLKAGNLKEVEELIKSFKRH